MKILIIGGTKFLGRHLIKAAEAKSHEITLFNRGKFSSEVFENIEQIHGDRHFDLEKLKDRNWDAVIDTCGYLPQSVKASAEFLKDSVGQYVFISSGSVYAEINQPNYDETTVTAKLSAEQQKAVEEIDLKSDLNGPALGENYGALKALCEQTIERVMPGRVLNVRAGMIVGTFDWTDRFSYWIMRVAGGGEILTPDNPQNPVQLIDARDLSDWIIKMIEANENGTFNVTSPPFALTFGKMLAEIKSATNSDAEFVWVDEDFLQENKVAPWSEMPFYLPQSDKTISNFLTMNVERALAKGLEFRPLSETVLEVFNWRKTINDELRAGLPVEKERELLQKWHQRK